ncbi:MAG: carbohydrate binding family 9 domain-containing protein [Bacteroidetes bacterium]|nr:carbohydrate binding family 9 domain-containing protein [Bacteroidota bacterium]
MKTAATLIFAFIFSIGLFANTTFYEKKTFNASPVSSESPTIDGILDDPCWLDAKWDNGFVQYYPVEGIEPSQQTKFALLFDNNYIYVAIKAFDNSPDSIVSRLTRRDQIDGDYVGIQFDSYLNHRTAYCFFVSSAGVKKDYFISNDGGNNDINWNPIWHVKTSKDDKGWYAEMKIPISQLRFNPSEANKWGFQVERKIYRNDETVLWQPVARNASGWVHYMGFLSGIDNIKAKKTFDLIPYTLTSAETFKAQPDNPFQTGKDYKFNGGLDGKIGITNYFTLDFTLNPDFGQVEADPSQVNLTAFESFFPEQRPFFTEGRDIFMFSIGLGDGDLGTENLLYSRRIGRSPRYSPSLSNGQFADVPEYTPIIGALKLTGRTNNGLSVGILQSSTASQYAEIDNLGDRSKMMVEPFTNYIAARVIQEINDGNTTIGAMGTAVNRNIKEEYLDFLNSSAYSGGVDVQHIFGGRKYIFLSSVYGSHVRGSENAMTRAQLSPSRYYQRPDADHLEFDPNRTSLSGFGGNFQLGKISGNLRLLGALMIKSPGLELNDIGYLREADNIVQVLWAGYRINEPFGIVRNVNVNFNQWSFFTFGNERTNLGGNVNGWMQFVNYWSMSVGANYNHEPLSVAWLRGGPSFAMNSSVNSWVSAGTDDRKAVRFSVSSNYQHGFENSYESMGVNVGITYRPHNALLLSLAPGYSQYSNQVQYVTTTNIGSEKVYIVGNLDQTVASLSLRINYTITPDLSLQYWGQPFIATGKYSDFKKVVNPSAKGLNDRVNSFTENQISYDANEMVYLVSESGNGNTDYGFYNPDFNFKEFLSNLVLRWEFRPGSTLFFVWSQTRNHFLRDGEFDFQHDVSELFADTPHNVFMLKFSYRIGV